MRPPEDILRWLIVFMSVTLALVFAVLTLRYAFETDDVSDPLGILVAAVVSAVLGALLTEQYAKRSGGGPKDDQS